MNNKFIIDTPKLQSLQLKYTSTIFTLIFWVLWFYLWIPLVTLVGWWFQIDTIQHTMITLNGFHAFLLELPILLTYILILIGLLAVWSSYNYFRFKGLERRKPLRPVSQNDILSKFSIDEVELGIIQENKIILIKFDENEHFQPLKIK